MAIPDPATTQANSPEWNLPDSEICSSAWHFVTIVSPPLLHHHCVRSYLFARELAAARGLRGGVDYDDELVFLSCLLHDLGMTPVGTGGQRFEVRGADPAALLLREHGMAGGAVTTVWQTIALHTSVGLGHRFGPVHAVSHAGIDLDIVGAGRDLLSASFTDRVTAAWPRLDVGFAIAEAIADDVMSDPRKAPPFSLSAHLHQAINGGPSIAFGELVAISGWGDRP